MLLVWIVGEACSLTVVDGVVTGFGGRARWVQDET
jgi:hypothetical protein